MQFNPPPAYNQGVAPTNQPLLLFQALNFPFHHVSSIGHQQHKIFPLRGMVNQDPFSYTIRVMDPSKSTLNGLPIGARVRCIPDLNPC
jgi:hypothetical protein